VTQLEFRFDCEFVQRYTHARRNISIIR